MSTVRLTDNEGTLLALVRRAQPITAYEIARVYDASPVSNFNTSKGKIYPLVKRLKQVGLLVGETVEGDRRGTERLSSTQEGDAALRDWLLEQRPTHVLLEDPLRTQVQSFDLLTRGERLDWIAAARAALEDKLVKLEAYAEMVEVPFHDLVHDNAVSSVEARLAWLDRVRVRVEGDRQEGPGATRAPDPSA